MIMILFASVTRGQSSADTIVQSILPINWSFGFDCLAERVFDTPAVYYTWTGESYLPSLAELGNNTFLIMDSEAQDVYWKLILNFDTIAHIVSASYTEIGYDGWSGSFAFSVPFDSLGSKIRDTVDTTASWQGIGGHSCHEGSGIVTTGGASLPSEVTATKTLNYSFSERFHPYDDIEFIFPSPLEMSHIQIFDLLGRMRDEIPIAPQTTNIEYAKNRLTSGMYIATLDGNAIKFIVP
jgi:hypothetical protein